MSARPRREKRSRVSRLRYAAAVCAALVLLATASGLLAPSASYAITRDAVIARAQSVMNDPVPYSQSRFDRGWRNDCSGFVSWTWGTGSNAYVTANMDSITTRIPKEQLQPGDALLKAGSHVRLFYAWADEAHTTYVAYEQTPPRTWSSIQNLGADIENGYVACRYDKITDSPPPWSALRNPTFNVWNKGSKSSDPSTVPWVPMWWSYGSTGAGTSWQIRPDQVSSPVWALGLTNVAATSSTFVEARQRAVAEPGKGYALTAQAGTTSKPSAVLLCLQFYSASNVLLRDARITGNQSGIGAAGLRPMSVVATAPAGTARADAIVGLSGATNPAGGSGGSAVFDDVNLYVISPLPVYRFYNSKTGAHFYTASGPERDVVISTLASTFNYEGAAYGVVATPANGSPLYRFYNRKNGTHFYTASASEVEHVKSALASTYTYDGPVYNVSAKPLAGAIPVHRFFNKKNGSHFYTISEAEKDAVSSKLSNVYTYEGPAFFLAK